DRRLRLWKVSRIRVDSDACCHWVPLRQGRRFAAAALAQLFPLPLQGGAGALDEVEGPSLLDPSLAPTGFGDADVVGQIAPAQHPEEQVGGGAGADDDGQGSDADGPAQEPPADSHQELQAQANAPNGQRQPLAEDEYEPVPGAGAKADAGVDD